MLPSNSVTNPRKFVLNKVHFMIDRDKMYSNTETQTQTKLFFDRMTARTARTTMTWKEPTKRTSIFRTSFTSKKLKDNALPLDFDRYHAFLDVYRPCYLFMCVCDLLFCVYSFSFTFFSSSSVLLSYSPIFFAFFSPRPCLMSGT